MTIPYDDAARQAKTHIERLRRSLWAKAREYQMSIDAFQAAGQSPPPIWPPCLQGRVRVTQDGTVEFLDGTDPMTPAD
jgi:hypothetical protein